MDESAQTYVKKLIEMGQSCTIPDITNVTNQLTLEVMVQTIFGDRGFNLIAINGNHRVHDSLIKICESKIY